MYYLDEVPNKFFDTKEDAVVFGIRKGIIPSFGLYLDGTVDYTFLLDLTEENIAPLYNLALDYMDYVAGNYVKKVYNE